MLSKTDTDKFFFSHNGYIQKNLFNKDKEFIDISQNLIEEIGFSINKENIKNLGGYRSGNLNINPGKYGNEFLYLLLKKNFKEYFKFITNDNFEDYSFLAGGNLNLPNSKNQFFHTDGKWMPRMIIVNIATSKIELSNGPLEIIEKSHLENLNYWKFALKIIFLKKKRIIMETGEILIREHRLWHRGTKNYSKNNREMIGLMFIKKPHKLNTNNEKNVCIKSNIFGNSFKERIKEYLFINFKPILFMYKFFISIIK